MEKIVGRQPSLALGGQTVREPGSIDKRPIVVSLFSGAGGLDLGFERAGFNVGWANEYDKTIWSTYEKNFSGSFLARKSIVDVVQEEIFEVVGKGVDGLIGGPPCQSWSEAGALRGIEDHRGQLFFEYIRLLSAIKPKFFVAENVSGILFDRHRAAFSEILRKFRDLGYIVATPRVVNANDFGVPQDRERVFIVGYHRDWRDQGFEFPECSYQKPVLRDALAGVVPTQAIATQMGRRSETEITNHEYMLGGFSSIFMSRQRVRTWDQPSFTIQAGARHAPLHPQAPKMEWVRKDEFRFVEDSEDLYRRLSVRECARVQTFPDDFEFCYDRIEHGYKMIGNAVPVELARRLGSKILTDVSGRDGMSSASSMTIASAS
jgi:DNA (cytosine-5)-methyltransferase 1